MCLIIQQPPGLTLPRERLITIGQRNPDGFGWAMPYRGAVAMDRWIPESPEQVADYYAAHLAGRAVALHWRKATSGPKTADMAHPFPLAPLDEGGNTSAALMHNGILPGGTSEESDTAALVRALIRPMTRDGAMLAVLDDPAVRPLLEKLISNSAVLIIGADGVARRWGNTGTEYEGAWYSNTYAWDDPRQQTRSQYGGRGGWSGYGRHTYHPGYRAQDGSFVKGYWDDDYRETRATRIKDDAPVNPAMAPLPKGETRGVKNTARALYLGPTEQGRTPEQIADDETLVQIATRPGRLTKADLQTVAEIKARRQARAAASEVAAEAHRAAQLVLCAPAVAPVFPQSDALKAPDASCNLSPPSEDEARILESVCGDSFDWIG